jgi:hypothetical protein
MLDYTAAHSACTGQYDAGEPRGVQKYFGRDNFKWRRSTGHNAYDPESLLTGAEIAAGKDYDNPRRYASQQDYDDMVSGRIPVELIPVLAPR